MKLWCWSVYIWVSQHTVDRGLQKTGMQSKTAENGVAKNWFKIGLKLSHFLDYFSYLYI